MPWSNNSDMPSSIRGSLPGSAQTIFRSAFNGAHAQGKSESECMQIAWGAVKNAGWAKDGEKWIHKEALEKFHTEFNIVKSTEQQMVFGWANVAVRKAGDTVVDFQQDVVDIEDLELAAYDFVLNCRDSGEMHQGEVQGHMVESFIVTPQKLEGMKLAPDALPLGWWVGFYIESPELFAKVKSGLYKMFSIQGKAKRIPI